MSAPSPSSPGPRPHVQQRSLLLEKTPGGGTVSPGTEPHVHASRLLIVGVFVLFATIVRLAWKRNGYVDAAGFAEVGAPATAAPGAPEGSR